MLWNVKVTCGRQQLNTSCMFELKSWKTLIKSKPQTLEILIKSTHFKLEYQKVIRCRCALNLNEMLLSEYFIHLSVNKTSESSNGSSVGLTVVYLFSNTSAVLFHSHKTDSLGVFLTLKQHEFWVKFCFTAALSLGGRNMMQRAWIKKFKNVFHNKNNNKNSRHGWITSKLKVRHREEAGGHMKSQGDKGTHGDTGRLGHGIKRNNAWPQAEWKLID